MILFKKNILSNEVIAKNSINFDDVERINLGFTHVIKQNIMRKVSRLTNLILDASYGILIKYLNTLSYISFKNMIAF